MKPITPETLTAALQAWLPVETGVDPEFEPLGEIVSALTLEEIGLPGSLVGLYLTMADGSTFTVTIKQVKLAEVTSDGTAD